MKKKVIEQPDPYWILKQEQREQMINESNNYDSFQEENE